MEVRRFDLPPEVLVRIMIAMKLAQDLLTLCGETRNLVAGDSIIQRAGKFKIR